MESVVSRDYIIIRAIYMKRETSRMDSFENDIT